MASGAGGEPELSVILPAYRRREYLPTALASVLRQGIPRNRMEIVVQTDFADPELDRILAAQGIVHRIDPEERIGRWLLGALDATRAPLVAIVEDDDVLAPERFERALEVLDGQPEIAFYRNRVSVIDSAGRRVPSPLWSRIETERALDRAGPLAIAPESKEAGIARMRALGLEWLNLSTMVFRRTIITPELRPAIAESHCPDLFTFVAAVLSPGGLYFDDRRLTGYRRHSGSGTRTLAWRRLHWADHVRWAAFARARGARNLADWLDARARLLQRVVEAGEVLAPVRSMSTERESAPVRRHYLAQLASDPILAPPAALRWLAGALASTYRVAPHLTRRVLTGCDRAFDLP